MSFHSTEILATILFAIAVLHTFLVQRFQHLALKFPEGSVGENFLHLLGEVEIVFGLWAGALVCALVAIPKHTGGVRMLGIPTVRDRVVQAAIKAVLKPLLNPTFSSHSYGFRPGRNQRQAVEAAARLATSAAPGSASSQLFEAGARRSQSPPQAIEEH